jgi:hypothetical protein
MTEQPGHSVARRHKNQLVGFGAEIDPVLLLELVTLDLRAVDERSMPALQILDPVFALFENDLGMHARSPVVAHHHLIAGLPPNSERILANGYGGAMTGRIHHDERGRFSVIVGHASQRKGPRSALARALVDFSRAQHLAV